MHKIYLASSWRNHYQPAMVSFLRDIGHEVYDFRNPVPGDQGYSWAEIDPDWQRWEPRDFRTALWHPIAEDSFGKDMGAIPGSKGGNHGLATITLRTSG